VSFYRVKVELPREVELTACAVAPEHAEAAAYEFFATAFHEALGIWDDNEPLYTCDGVVQITMPNGGIIELPDGAVEILAREESQQ
jgi:hypothetical protein